MSSWIVAMLGGVLIGLSATALLLFNGRIAGVSGIVNGLTRRSSGADWAWRAAFVAGLAGAGGITMHLLHQATPSPARLPVLLLAGVLVGFGTSLGSGCTSGHGVCGLGRFSRRSLVAVVTFITSAIITVLLTHHLPGGAA
ncbi:MAG TPA: YeeE/YedE family protein [Rudaea sp.]|nr:YeeE/YedE family protein [Rudaea sp.]HSC12418.1 YeeE/YedE family protein [Rhodanobacteraceae bacterium]